MCGYPGRCSLQIQRSGALPPHCPWPALCLLPPHSRHIDTHTNKQQQQTDSSTPTHTKTTIITIHTQRQQSMHARAHTNTPPCSLCPQMKRFEFNVQYIINLWHSSDSHATCEDDNSVVSGPIVLVLPR